MILIASFSGILIVFRIFFGLKIWIKAEANEVAKEAIAVFQKDKSQSLLSVIEAPDFSLIEKILG